MDEVAEVRWILPDSPQGKVRVQQNGTAIEFGMAVSDSAELFRVMQGLNWYVSSLQTLFRALKRLEGGEVDYKGAADRIAQINQELDKANARVIAQAKAFWKFTEYADKPDEQKRIERLFAKDGSRFIQFVVSCMERVLMSEGQIKN